MSPPAQKKSRSLKTLLLIALIGASMALVAWYFFAPLLGISLGFTGAALGGIIVTLLVLAGALIFIPLITGLFIALGMFLLIILFPVILPIIVTILIVGLIIHLFRK